MLWLPTQTSYCYCKWPHSTWFDICGVLLCQNSSLLDTWQTYWYLPRPLFLFHRPEFVNTGLNICRDHYKYPLPYLSTETIFYRYLIHTPVTTIDVFTRQYMRVNGNTIDVCTSSAPNYRNTATVCSTIHAPSQSHFWHMHRWEVWLQLY